MTLDVSPPGRGIAGLVIRLGEADRLPGRASTAPLAELSRLGIHVVVLTSGPALRVARALGATPPGPGRLWVMDEADHVEVTRSGLRGPTPADGATALTLLAEEGVTGRLVLEATAGTVAEVVAEQTGRARRRRVPGVDPDPAWTIVEHGVDEVRHRVTESLFTLSSAGVALRGSVEENPGFGQPLVLAAGLYDGHGSDSRLLPGPDIVDVELSSPVRSDVRTLDLRTGVLLREEEGDAAPLRSLRFGSVTEPGVFAVRVEAGAGRLRLPTRTLHCWTQTTGTDGGIGAAFDEIATEDGVTATLQRIVAVDAAAAAPPGREAAQARLRHATHRGFERLLADQRAAWATRWRAVDVRIPADPWTERALRFAVFQLWSVAASDDPGRELAVGARGLTGSGYRGHVFWDADVFVLPALTTIAPAAAAGIVEYRLRRLGAARSRALADGHAGARFPWESAHDGTDVTPASGLLGGDPVPILTGALEEHITADVAWATVHHATWARPRGSLTAREAVLLRDTARYWASRARRSDDGRAHIDGVIGPDEYHEGVDDDAFTNGMARWNLRAAARLAPCPGRERAEWLRLADALADGYDPGRRVHEQFRGYFALEPLAVRALAEPPVAADVLAGRERIAASQIIKQPDVLMLHHLLPDDLPTGSLAADYDLYAPRTSHGSSLSPAVMAAVAARAHHPDAALDLLRLSLRIDLDDVGGTTASGVHLGACGGAWQAVVAGFLGARLVAGVLELDPVLPSAWRSLEVRFRCLGRDVRVRAAERVTVDASAPMRVRVTRGRGVAGAHVELVEEEIG